MSIELIRSFLEKIENSPELIEEAKPMNVGDILLLARREGYEITNRDWKAYIQEKIRQASSVQLSDADLDGVAAGVGVVNMDLPASSLLIC
ncbi:MAG: Nif11-like leader peptide family RiPP precursor [Anaerolineales bacterium]|nr:Nif11-like leader peptide family natural product precursor [Chloroflexota bacterium]MBL6982843.1 Nif11-like leader peptide family RiPP precursor [Anaerolineales bacterium]